MHTIYSIDMSRSLIMLLIHNRPKILKCCVSIAIKYSKIVPNAYWAAMDNSSTEHTQKNSDVLKEITIID